MKKNIALIAGGYSGEFVISVNSAAVIKKNINSNLYTVYTLIITDEKWVYVNERNEESWVDKNDFTIIHEGNKIFFDCALITIHGSPGEDGKIQGYLEMMNIPFTTAGQMACSVTFNKYFCNALAAGWGMDIAHSVKYTSHDKITSQRVLEKVKLPVFVKPNKGGSSLGTTFVEQQEQLLPAIHACLEHDDEVFIEEFIDGTELTCGVYTRHGKTFVLPVTEIVSKTEARFFDYKAKYTKGAADEITPARISDTITALVKDTTAFLYEKFELKGICRLDYIYSQGKLFFLEANITPGMSERSIVPQQAEYIGITLTSLFTDVIEDALRRKTP